MFKSLAGAALSLLLAHPLVQPSYAQENGPDPRVEQLLQKLESLSNQPSGPAAPVSRNFAIRVKTTVTVTAPPPPHDLMCTITLFHFSLAGTSYFETKSKKYATPAGGGTVLCDITTKVKWLNADDTRTVSINVTLRPLIRRIATLPNEEEYERNRTSSANLLPIPLPANGSTTLVTTALTL